MKGDDCEHVYETLGVTHEGAPGAEVKIVHKRCTKCRCLLDEEERPS